MRRSTSIDFAENQLSPSLIGLSPLATAHPRLFQQTWVRSSRMYYHPFNLAMARSLGFGSSTCNLRPIKTRFRYAYIYRLKLAAYRNSLTHYTKGTPSPHMWLRLLVSTRFQVYFTPLIGVLFTFPSRYLFTIGHQVVFRLGRRSSHLQSGFHVPRPTRKQH